MSWTYILSVVDNSSYMDLHNEDDNYNALVFPNRGLRRKHKGLIHPKVSIPIQIEHHAMS